MTNHECACKHGEHVEDNYDMRDVEFHLSNIDSCIQLALESARDAYLDPDAGEHHFALADLRMQQAQVHATLFAALRNGEGQ